jgi:hypothetical protein
MSRTTTSKLLAHNHSGGGPLDPHVSVFASNFSDAAYLKQAQQHASLYNAPDGGAATPKAGNLAVAGISTERSGRR